MAFLRRRDVTQAFRSNQQLQQFVLTGVTTTGRVLGTGSYGAVEEVTYKHISCAGKRLHEALIDVENEGADEMVCKYLRECQLMSSLRHPNITQFLGLYFLPGTRLPLLVMERLETSLDDLLEHMPGLPLSLKHSVLEDVASGLLYLHDRHSPVIHRDLTARNVLLTLSLVAKITDMGNSRIIDMRPGQMARTLSALPGTSVYMPPEALDDRHCYGPSLDIFSFGHLALFTITQTFPGSLLPSTYPDPDNPGQVLGRTEVERRQPYIDLLESISTKLPNLIQLVKQCLNNVPNERPNTVQLLSTLQRMKVEVEGEYGGPIRLDMVRVRLAKEVKMNGRRIEELTQQQERHEDQLERMTGELEEKDAEIVATQRELATKDEQIATKDRDIATKDRDIATKERDLATKDAQIQQLRNDVATRDGHICDMETQLEELKRDQQLKETQLQSKDAEIRRLREELRKGQFGQVPLKFPLQLSWRCGPNMPFGMQGYVQSVVVQGRVYVGGGWIDGVTVVEYDISLGQWSELPPYRASSFAMTVISNQLVLVGGLEHGGRSKVLGVWRAESKEWTHPYPDIPTGRSVCSAVVYNEWLVVAGGWGDRRLSSVEVMNTDTKQWYAGPPTPTPWSEMKTAVVGDTCYFMSQGAFKEATGTTSTNVYSLSLPALIDQIYPQNSRESSMQCQLWKRIPDLQTMLSFPLSISGSLLAVGGKDEHKAVTSIHLYQPDTGEWVKVGDLPTPQYRCTCALITDRQLVVVGGQSDKELTASRMDIACIH